MPRATTKKSDGTKGHKKKAAEVVQQVDNLQPVVIAEPVQAPKAEAPLNSKRLQPPNLIRELDDLAARLAALEAAIAGKS